MSEFIFGFIAGVVTSIGSLMYLIYDVYYKSQKDD
jgi:hypothetical protein